MVGELVKCQRANNDCVSGKLNRENMQLFDTHCHLIDERFDADRTQFLRELPEKAVAFCVENATDRSDWPAVAEIASRNEYIYAAFGVHPHSAALVRSGYLDDLESYLKNPKCVAVGEIGLDYHYDFSPREQQKRVFIEQIELAIAHDLPIVVHDREAHEDIFSILQQYKGRVRGEMHCYSGSAEMLSQVAELDFYVGFGGPVTFKKAQRPQKAVAAAPLNRILLETDCPYLSPEPHRGKRNDPSMTRFICEKIAEIRNIDAEEMASITTENGKRFFGIHD